MFAYSRDDGSLSKRPTPAGVFEVFEAGFLKVRPLLQCSPAKALRNKAPEFAAGFLEAPGFAADFLEAPGFAADFLEAPLFATGASKVLEFIADTSRVFMLGAGSPKASGFSAGTS